MIQKSSIVRTVLVVSLIGWLAAFQGIYHLHSPLALELQQDTSTVSCTQSVERLSQDQVCLACLGGAAFVPHQPATVLVTPQASGTLIAFCRSTAVSHPPFKLPSYRAPPVA